mgnify:CR=1 FL=1
MEPYQTTATVNVVLLFSLFLFHYAYSVCTLQYTASSGAGTELEVAPAPFVPIEGHNRFSDFLTNESLRRTSLHQFF